MPTVTPAISATMINPGPGPSGAPAPLFDMALDISLWAVFTLFLLGLILGLSRPAYGRDGRRQWWSPIWLGMKLSNFLFFDRLPTNGLLAKEPVRIEDEPVRRPRANAKTNGAIDLTGYATAVAAPTRPSRLAELVSQAQPAQPPQPDLSDQEIISRLRAMPASTFESFVREMFRRNGHSPWNFKATNTGNINIIMESRDGRRHAIQCRCLSSELVMPEDVRAFYVSFVAAGLGGKAYFITTNRFADEALVLRQHVDLELIDCVALPKLVRQAGLMPPANPRQAVADQSRAVQACPECGGGLVSRGNRATYGGFLVCSRSECRYMIKEKAEA